MKSPSHLAIGGKILKMIKNHLLLLLLTLISFSISAQEEMEDEDYIDEEYYEDTEYNFKKTLLLGANLQFGIPQGAMRRLTDKTSWGFGGSALGRLRMDAPIYAGIDFSIQTFDRESLIEEEFLNGVLEQFRVTTKNHVMNAHFLVRYQPEVNFFIQPYVEGLLGTKWFYTRTTVTDANNSQETLSSDIDRGDWGASFGAAVGFQISLKQDQLFLEGRCAYLKGTSVEYLVRNPDASGGFLDPIEAFEPQNSVSDLLIPQIGLKFLIGWGNADEGEEYIEEEEEYE